MIKAIEQQDIEARIIRIRGENLLIDGDVAEIDGVEINVACLTLKHTVKKKRSDHDT